MAKEAVRKPSNQELAESYAKLKARTRNAQLQAKREGEALVEDVITVAAAGGLGMMMGQRLAQGEKAGKTGDELTAEAQMGGIDIDLLVGGAATAAGMFKLGGKMSNTVRKIGIGGLSAYAARVGYEKGQEGVFNAKD